MSSNGDGWFEGEGGTISRIGLFAVVMDRLMDEIRQQSPFVDGIMIYRESSELVEESLER